MTVEVFNIRGQRVQSLFSGDMEAGEHLLSWDGMGNSGQALSTGLYLVRMRIGEEVLVKKVSLQRM